MPTLLPTNPGCLGSIWNKLFGPVPFPLPPYWASFTLEQVNGKNFRNLLGILQGNHIVVPSNGTDPEKHYVSIGWQFHYTVAGANSSNMAKTDDQASITPSMVSQIVAHFYGSQRKFLGVSRHSVWEELTPNLPVEDLSTASLNIETNHHKKFPDHLTPYHNFISTPIITDDLLLEKFEFYKPETELIFFSRTQLLLMKAILEKRSKCTVLFSGFDTYVGRTAMPSRMLSMQSQQQKNMPDPTHWFTLKAEIMDTRAFQSDAEELSDISLIKSKKDREKLPDPVSPRAMRFCELQGSDNDPPSIPVAYVGENCPDPWYFLAALTKSLLNYDPSLDPEKAMCIMEDNLMQGNPVMSPPSI